jgi:hypothetical protein
MASFRYRSGLIEIAIASFSYRPSLIGIIIASYNYHSKVKKSLSLLITATKFPSSGVDLTARDVLLNTKPPPTRLGHCRPHYRYIYYNISILEIWVWLDIKYEH